MGRGVPTLPDNQTLMAMGYNQDGVKVSCSSVDGWLHDEIKKNLRIMDEQQFIHRYKWHNLPKGLSQDLIERILYYRGTGVLFYSIEMQQFFFLPYTNTREIDCYGRFTEATPLPFTGATTAKDKDGKVKQFIPGLVLKQQYELCQGVEDLEDITGVCIPLFDYTKQLSQNIIPRQQLSEAILDLESDLIPYMKTALMNATGVVGVKVGSEDEQADVQLASMAVDRAAKNQLKYIPFVGNMEFQNLTSDNVARSEEFLIAMQSIDNFRKMLIGLGEGNLFQTKAHMLQSQMDMASTGVSMQYQDGLYQRQTFCNIVNSFFPIGIWCDEGEAATGFDQDMDGIADDEVDQEGIGNELPEQEGDNPNV